MRKNTDNLNKKSVEMGTTTDVTQVLLTQIECTEIKKPPPIRHSYKNRKEKPNKVTCSDLRIAELGASTEIANMALRKKSEVPVIIKSESRLHREESISLSMLKQESDISGDVNEEWTGSAYSTLRDSSTRPLMDRRIGSILKLPYKCFKKNILNRSSLISVLISNSSSEQEKMRIANKLRILFQEEIIDHQRRGMKSLYSTINRRKTPYRMGWLNLMMKISRTIVPNETKHHKRCKHFRRSHSYRCMRAKVMRLAGPTKSELAEFREKVKNAMAPDFVKNLIAYNKRYAIMMSKACGSDAHDGESIRKHLQKLVK
ncbi:hypothetical protein O3G_MSEX003088 [Manduca sexta]|uniref:Uncharacterized protein n=2 Tax=Manduca sexta TaxID=7130 RepID=A0A922CEF4_MANSE|nr:hypothetical protein O3G_MSEX003088 [Manduca sexta]